MRGRERKKRGDGGAEWEPVASGRQTKEEG